MLWTDLFDGSWVKHRHLSALVVKAFIVNGCCVLLVFSRRCRTEDPTYRLVGRFGWFLVGMTWKMRDTRWVPTGRETYGRIQHPLHRS